MRFLKIAFFILLAVVIALGIVLFFLSKSAKADSNVGTNVASEATSSVAWSDVSGWWDFHGTHTVIVGTSSLHGYASSSIGEISLNCDTSSSGNVCATSNYAVTNASGSGLLAGCAWNDAIGWISFSCDDQDCDGVEEGGGDSCPNPATDYQVSIGVVNTSGTFSGYAWNDVEGWISFNCNNNGTCGTSDFRVVTSWSPGVLAGYAESSTLDTGVSDAVLASISWQGSQPSGTSVDFQIATSSSASGPWTYTGPSGSATAYYGVECPLEGSSNPGAGADKAICVDKNIVRDFRYIRYKVRLQSDTSQTLSPQVNDIVLNFVK